MSSRIYTEIITIGGVSLYDVNADPNGALFASEGSLALRSDTGNASLYQNTDGSATWVLVGSPFISQNRLVGRISAGLGPEEELTAAQAKTILGAGAANGLATLGADTKVPAAQLPKLGATIGDFPIDVSVITYQNWRAPFNATILQVVSIPVGAALTDTSLSVEADPFGVPTGILTTNPTPINAAEGVAVSPAISGTTYDIDEGDSLRFGVICGASATGTSANISVIYQRR